jgi:hypothetical protein
LLIEIPKRSCILHCKGVADDGADVQEGFGHHRCGMLALLVPLSILFATYLIWSE